MVTLKELTKEAEAVTDWSSAREYDKKFQKHKKELLSETSESDWESVRDFILTSLRLGFSQATESAAALLDRRKLINWKAHTEIFDESFDIIVVEGLRSEDEELLHISDYSDFIEKIINLFKGLSILSKYEPRLYEVAKTALSTKDNRLQLPAIKCIVTISWDKHSDWIAETMSKALEIVQEYPDMPKKHNLACDANLCLTMIFTKIAQNHKQAKEIVNTVKEIFDFTSEQDWIDLEDSDERTISHEMCCSVMSSYLTWHKEVPEILKPLYPTLKKLWECEDEELQRDANNIISSLGAAATEVMGYDVDMLIQQYLSGEQPTLVAQFHTMYPSCREKFHPHVDEFAEAMDGREDWVYSTTLTLFWEIAKHSPESFNKKTISLIVDSLTKQNTGAIGMMSLSVLAEHRPKDVVVHDDAVISRMRNDATAAAQGGQVLVQLAAISEAHAAKYLEALKICVESSSSMMAMGLIYNMRTIGAAKPRLLLPHKQFLEKLLKDPALKEHAQGILDIMEGRTLENISKDVEEQKDDIVQLDTRVTQNEGQIDELDENVSAARKDISGLRQDVDTQEVRLTEVEYQADETADKVEEIDKKTLSHAPMWSRDVAVLMNAENTHDWRLLASRLGYTNDDIRNWATQPNPCLSLLDEWFATQKTREATFAVLKALQEMNREDAAMIVENALKQAEGVVEDEEEDTGPTPTVFLSYQWGHQQEVRLLKQHLEMAGYTCWMDIGQMGGGDKLFAKIDQGIRAAKVVICCVTEKYAASPNCNREVNLAVTLGKPMLPLLMEKMSWPPAGSMGPIFGEYLFIRFFARPGETAGDERYWPTAKFTELLFQVRINVAPDHDTVSKEYANWWEPQIEDIVIKPREENKGDDKSNSAKLIPAHSDSPQVFISYQWGKQPQIKKLFGKLSSEGYTCWLDIMQMGGGDSLYDKIDKGVRGCDVVLSCVTSKYSLSANCRREVSLADALKKPIIPLLLENITWPPEGPMSMVFTQLLYINFCKPDVSVQENWVGPQFNELLGKIQMYVIKDISPALPESTSNGKTPITNTNDAPNTTSVTPKKDPPKKSGFCQLL